MPVTLAPTGVSTHAFTQEQFGANTLSPRDRLGDEGTFDDKIEALGVEHIRFPGGSLTEFYFDIGNPDATRNTHPETGEVKEVLPYSNFMTWAEEAGIAVNVVLPTRGALSDDRDANGDRYATIDEEELRGFIRDTLDGTYGAPEIQAFEIGNEYWGSGRMSAVEYGRVASEMSAIVKDEMRAHPDFAEKFSETDVAVQMGHTYGFSDIRDDYDHLSPEEQVAAISEDYGIEVDGRSPDYSQIADQMILEEFDTADEIDSVDAVVAHVYSKAPAIPHSRTWDLSEVDAAGWDETFGEDLTRYVTEWNQSANTGALDRDTDYGLKNAREMLEIAETFPENHVEAAHVWAVQQNTPTDLGNNEGEDGLTVPGEMFRLMAESLPGKREVILDEDARAAEKEAEDQDTGDEIHAFAGEDDMAVFAFAGEDTEGEMEIDLTAMLESYGSATITRIGVPEGVDPGDARAEPVVETLPAEELIEDGILTADMTPHEILHIAFEDVRYTEEMDALIEDAEAREAAEDLTAETPDDPGWQDWTGRHGIDHGAEDMADTPEPSHPEEDTDVDEPGDEADAPDMGDVDPDVPDMPPAPETPYDDRPRENEEDDEPEDRDDDQGQDQGGSTDASCFVATAAYSDPLHPDVCDLRRFRDECLVNHATGRAFIAFYWHVGPGLARRVRGRPVPAALSRAAIRPIVAVLRRTVLK